MKSTATNRKGAKLRISEIYASVQGEGVLTGTPSIFVRTSGCNLRCWFCDTPYASWQPEGSYHSVSEVVDQVVGLGGTHVVLTGGEPMIYANLPVLCAKLVGLGYHLTIETAATLYRPVDCGLISISPKLSGSAPRQASPAWIREHQRRRERIDVVSRLMQEHEYQLKFVVDSLEDAAEVLRYLERLPAYDGRRVLLMPQGTLQDLLEKQSEWLIPWCEKHALQFCPRAHIEWYGNRRGS